jgi:hypothetical protein
MKPMHSIHLIIRKLKNAVFWDVAPYGFIINCRFEGTCRLHLQGSSLTVFLARVIFSTLKMEATRSSETLVYNKPTQGTHP